MQFATMLCLFVSHLLEDNKTLEPVDANVTRSCVMKITNLSTKCKRKQILGLVKPAGNVVNLKLCQDASAKTFALVTFESRRVAKAAVEMCQGKELHNLEMQATLESNAEEDQKNDSSPLLMVARLAPEVTDSVLLKTFETCGSVRAAKVEMKKGNPTGVGYVLFKKAKSVVSFRL
eukprot:m.156430 g.156430  ORF g.156430 m.156430 type:complete len:176 (-) comp15099_c0_seq7:4683-5210(-)